LNGGELVGRVLERHGVRFLYTLCGGHISPILAGAKQRGIRVVDVRDEASAVFAADATARLTGIPGVAAVTAGPGVTNAVTAVKNAQLAQTPLVLLGGATATVLSGRGSLQDIDQVSLLASAVKRTFTAASVADVPEMVDEAFGLAADGVPGPVFVELPVDLLYGEELVREWYGGRRGGGLSGWLLRRYLGWHVDRLFKGADEATDLVRGMAGASASDPADPLASELAPLELAPPHPKGVRRAARWLASARRPLLLVGSQAMLGAGRDGAPAAAAKLAAAVRELGVPTYLAGGSRGLLGAGDELQMRHKRRRALKEADLVILAGVPCDFRLDYGRSIGGRSIGRRVRVVAANLSAEEANRNRKPELLVEGDPGQFLVALADAAGGDARQRWTGWHDDLRGRDRARDAEIEAMSTQVTEYVNPVALCRAVDDALADDSVVIGDGGDFVATAAYVVSPRRPLSWLDPGVFGTLGVGGGFALAAKLCRPAAEVWLLWGDGSAAYSLAEIDTCVRHGIPVIAVVGNDAGWTQIAREQIQVLGDDVGTVLARTDYHRVAEGYGGAGILVEQPEQVAPALAEAKRLAAAGRPVVVNVLLGESDFRKGSISM
jgi:acetolactate synthase-1/2/3 large subunit